MEVVGRDEVALLERIDARVLQMPDGAGLADLSSGEADDARLLAKDLRVLADLSFGGRALVVGDIRRERELSDFARHGPR